MQLDGTCIQDHIHDHLITYSSAAAHCRPIKARTRPGEGACDLSRRVKVIYDTALCGPPFPLCSLREPACRSPRGATNLRGTDDRQGDIGLQLS